MALTQKELRAKIKQACLDTVPECIAMMLAVAKNPRERSNDRITAARELLDRGLGKPEQAINLDGLSLPPAVQIIVPVMGGDDAG